MDTEGGYHCLSSSTIIQSTPTQTAITAIISSTATTTAITAMTATVSSRTNVIENTTRVTSTSHSMPYITIHNIVVHVDLNLRQDKNYCYAGINFYRSTHSGFSFN